MNTQSLRLATFPDLLARYTRVFRAARAAREQLMRTTRTPLERQFLPAALEIIETPAPALPRAIIATIVTAFLLAIACSNEGSLCKAGVKFDPRPFFQNRPTHLSPKMLPTLQISTIGPFNPR